MLSSIDRATEGRADGKEMHIVTDMESMRSFPFRNYYDELRFHGRQGSIVAVLGNKSKQCN